MVKTTQVLHLGFQNKSHVAYNNISLRTLKQKKTKYSYEHLKVYAFRRE